MSINWNNIRAIEGQREGFEELVCQLAGQEKITDQIEFTRIGKPDAGKECYWQLRNGNIHCWQAKYFMNSLSDGQWAQLNKSVKNAIDNHPTLIKYYVTIPIDRPDGKAKGKSMLQKWKDHVTDWKKYALDKNMTVQFEYWGKHELEKRLRQPENEGLIYYFFNKTELTDTWFQSKNQDSVDALGGRYSPEINFKLPLFNFIDGINRDKKFSKQIDSFYEKVIDQYRRTYLSAKRNRLKQQIDSLDKAVKIFRKTYENLSFAGVSNIPFDSLKNKLGTISKNLEVIRYKYCEWRDEEEKSKEEKGEKINYYLRPYNNQLNEIQELINLIYDFEEFLNTPACALINNPYLIIVGPAGIGKSHVLADITSQRSKDGKTTLLLLGENFSTNDMAWTQILRNQIRFSGNEDVFLGALNAKAESQQQRIIVIIDALNEGNGRKAWPKKLKAFIRSFHRYPWLGLIVSIRDSYEDLIAPKSDIDFSIASRVYHSGFEGVEYEASIHFFKYYNIVPTGSPMMNPEFQNPLFLKLFCLGLETKGLNEVPDGYQGISTIIEFYLEGIEEKLSQPDQLDYDIRLKLMRKAVDGILTRMVDDGEDHLCYETGEEITSDIFRGKCGSDDKQYLKKLISEGVINEDLYWKKSKHYDGIHFAYQRFQDHLIVSSILDKHLNVDNPEESFIVGPLSDFLKNMTEARHHQNIIEALSVQIPERAGKELHEVAPYAAKYYSVVFAFINGLIWRRSDTIGESSRMYVNDVISNDDTLFYRFLETSISMATKPDFYFNADKNHEYLFKQSLAQRDSWWTIWLQDKYGENSSNNPVKRLIDWGWSASLKDGISDESARLAAVMLTWFLSSANRYLRDATTKALICLLQTRIPILLKLLQQFEEVNDPYIFERLYAVGYGCTLRTTDYDALIPLSEYIYKSVFDKKYVYSHILLRDYARGIIEYTLYIKLNPAIEIRKIRPPYKSDFPDKFPTNEEIDLKYKPKDKEGNYSGEKWGSTAIISSMTTEYGRGIGGYGDFGRYTFQSALSDWEVDYNGLSNYAIQRIFELGYDPLIFTEFDSKQGSGKNNGHMERIGKKYQWIAFYEILAKVSDNYKQFKSSTGRWSDIKEYRNFGGPWSPYVRDIDPTIIIKKTKKENYIEKIEELPWWIPCKYDNWTEETESWQKRFDDFPRVQDLITVLDSNRTEWLNLNIHPDWRELKKLGENHWDANIKRLWYGIGSYLVKPKELKKMLDVNEINNPYGNWTPSISNRYEVFSREYYWSPASEFFNFSSYDEGDFIPCELTDPKSRKRIARSHNTALWYLWEEEFDCSKDETIAYFKPAFILSFGLKPSLREGQYVNKQDEVVCFDPSVYERGPSCLLIRKDYILKILKDSNLRLVWVVQGRKQILGKGKSPFVNHEHNVGGLFHMDNTGKINGDLKSYFSIDDKDS